MKNFIRDKKHFKKYYLIGGVCLFIITVPLSIFIYKKANTLTEEVKKKAELYKNINTSTENEKLLLDKLIKENKALIECSKLSVILWTLLMISFPLISSIFSIILWRLSTNYLKFFEMNDMDIIKNKK